MRFAAIGLDHRHIYDITQGLLDAGLFCAGYCPETTDARVLAGFRKRFPDVPAVDRARLLDDPTIALVALAAVPSERGPIAVAAMRRGKDVVVDKPGVATLDQLTEVERAAAETGRAWSVCLSARFVTPSVRKALEIVRAGGIGRVVQTVGLGPHRLNRALRPAWFWDRANYGGILNDIGCHQIDLFLAFAGGEDAEIVSATVGEYGTAPGFEDFGEIVLQTGAARGYARVDWFTPDGLPTWGDGRMFATGTEGMIEVRKNLDIAGRDGPDHLFLVDRNGMNHIDCAGLPVTWFHDVAHRTAAALPQSHAFTVTRLALEAQARAARFVAKEVPSPRRSPASAGEGEERPLSRAGGRG